MAKLRDAIVAIESEKSAKLNTLRDSAREHQLETYLKGRLVEHARIPGIGAARLDTLRSNGIETAADVDYSGIMSIPGFGPELAGRLTVWRNSIAAKFRFDPTKGLPASVQQNIEIQFLQRRLGFERQLQVGPKRLRNIAATLARDLESIDFELVPLEQEVAQAKADMDAWRLH